MKASNFLVYTSLILAASSSFMACKTLDTPETTGGDGGSGGGLTSVPACVPRVCATGIDCGMCGQVDVWSKSFATALSSQVVHAVDRSPTGDILIAGDFSGSIDIGAGNPSTIETSDFSKPFALRLRGDAKGKWVVALGTPDKGTIHDGYFEPNDDSVIVAGTEEIAQAGTATVHKIGADGKIVWKTAFSPDTMGPNNEFTTVTRDANGDVIAAGFAVGTLTFPCGPAGQTPNMMTVFGGGNLFITKLDGATGQCRWAKLYEGAGSSPTGITYSPKGEIIVAGYYTKDFIVDGMPVLPTAAPTTMFIAALDATDGKHAWARAFTNTALPNQIKVVDGKQIVMTGTFTDSVDFGDAANPLVLQSMTGDAFVVSFDLAGKALWATQMPAFYARPMGLASVMDADGASALYMSGIATAIQGGGLMLNGSAPETTLCPTNGGVFLVRIDPATGKPRYGSCFGAIPDQSFIGQTSALLAGGGKELIFAGSLAGTFDFGAGPMSATSDKATTIMVAKFSPAP